MGVLDELEKYIKAKVQEEIKALCIAKDNELNELKNEIEKLKVEIEILKQGGNL